jgi:hypothetical protein
MAGGTAGRRSERSSSRHVLTGRRQPRAVAPGGSVDTSCAAMLANLVHELRTPVAALATGSEVLLDDLDNVSRDDLDARGRLA